MFLQDVCDDISLPVETRLIAARWLGQLSVKRAQCTFANVEMAALDDAFSDYKYIGLLRSMRG